MNSLTQDTGGARSQRRSLYVILLIQESLINNSINGNEALKS